MPLLSKITDSQNRSQTQYWKSIKATVRYCDSQRDRHYSTGTTVCSYASPTITSLVPEEQRHERLRNGIQTTHFSFTALQTASLVARVQRRFESIENDRHEHVVDVLNDICHKMYDTNELLLKITAQVDKDGNVCSLLKKICDSLKTTSPSNHSSADNWPQLETLAKSTALIGESNAQMVTDLSKIREEFTNICSNQTTALEKIVEDNRTYWNQLLSSGIEIKDKTPFPVPLVADQCSDYRNDMKDLKENVIKIKDEVQIANNLIEKMDDNIQLNDFELKNAMIDMKHEILQIKDEIIALREAIIDVLPLRLNDVMKGVFCGQSSQMGSDIEFIDNEEEVEEEEEEEISKEMNNSEDTTGNDDTEILDSIDSNPGDV